MILLAPFIFIILYIILSPLSNFIRVSDIPDKSSHHYVSTPLLGGIIIYLTLAISLYFSNQNNTLINIIFSSSFIVFLGYLDDSIKLGIKIRLILQLSFILFIVINYNFYITDFGFFSISTSSFYFISLFISVLSILALTNAFNFIDGINGLCSGLFLISFLNIKIIYYLNTGNFYFLELDLLLILVFIFFIINIGVFKIQIIFLGDSGSNFLGFISSIFLIYLSQKYDFISPDLVLWIVAVPLFDFFSVILRRILSKKNPMFGDKNHFHHLLIKKGYKPNHTLLIILTISFALSFIGFLISHFVNDFFSVFSFFLLFIFFFIYNNKLNKVVSL